MKLENMAAGAPESGNCTLPHREERGKFVLAMASHREKKDISKLACLTKNLGTSQPEGGGKKKENARNARPAS